MNPNLLMLILIVIADAQDSNADHDPMDSLMMDKTLPLPRYRRDFDLVAERGRSGTTSSLRGKIYGPLGSIDDAHNLTNDLDLELNETLNLNSKVSVSVSKFDTKV